MADNNQQITIWGRPNSVNVQKVLWCLHELDLAYERIDAGMAFGRNTEPDYLAMNPNGRVPTLVEGDFVLRCENAVFDPQGSGARGFRGGRSCHDQPLLGEHGHGY